VTVFGIALALIVGFVLGLLGGGGSILAVPTFLYVFHVDPKPAIAMSLVVVGMSALVGFLTHWRQGTVNVRIAVAFGALAMVGSFAGARAARFVPASVQLAMFAAFALTAAVMMLRDSLRARATQTSAAVGPQRFTPLLGVEAVAVGVLTALIGAGGGFLIVPALVVLAKVPIKEAVGTSLVVITMNTITGFLGYVGHVPIAWIDVALFTGVAVIGILAGTRLVRYVSQAQLRRALSVFLLIMATLILWENRGCFVPGLHDRQPGAKC